MRGRTINGFVAVLGQLDTQATAANSPGYDPLFREPLTTIDATGQRTKTRKEREVRCLCQVETGQIEAQTMTPTGNAPVSSLTLVFHWCDLQEAGLIGDDDRPLVQVNDRLVRLLDRECGKVVTEFDRVPLYVTEATPSGYGFGGHVNLLVCRLNDRPQAKRQ